MKDSYFKDKVVWVTGASSGIGAALCEVLSKSGSTIILSSRDKSALEKLKASLQYSENGHVVTLDVSDQNQISSVAKSVIEKFGKVDILINNAGVSQRELAVHTELSVDRKIMNINYFGSISLTKALLPEMIGRRAGHIVVISSVTGIVGAPLRSAYAASKHALHGFYDSLRSETEKAGIFTTIVCPGYIRTNISINALKGDGSPQNSMDQKTGEGMDPGILAAKILNAIASKKREVYFGGKEVIIIYLKRFIPSLYYKIINNIIP